MMRMIIVTHYHVKTKKEMISLKSNKMLGFLVLTLTLLRHTRIELVTFRCLMRLFHEWTMLDWIMRRTLCLLS